MKDCKIKQEILEEYSLPFALLPDSRIRPEQTVLIILPGQYEDWRFSQLRDIWSAHADCVIVAGTRDDQKYDEEKILYLLGGKPNQLYFQGWGANTPEQMDWVVNLIVTLLPKQVILSTASYHLPRCTLTFIKSFLKKGYEHTFSLAVLPTNGLDVDATLLAGKKNSETERIRLYQIKGDVATLEEYKKFLA